MRDQTFQLSGSVALITGAGSGIGKATAQVLGAQGAKIVVTERPSHAGLADSVVKDLRAQGVEAMAMDLDVKATLTMPHAIDQIINAYGQLDILVNNAGIQLFKAALDLDESEFDEVIDVNLKGAFMMSQAAAAVMVQQKSGCIINVASQHGVVGNRMRAPYCASKAGLINLTRALALEWAEYGIRVNAISPTYVINDQNSTFLMSPEFVEDIRQNLPLGQPASAEDVAWGICYLASPKARMVTGHNLMVDGGWTAR